MPNKNPPVLAGGQVSLYALHRGRNTNPRCCEDSTGGLTAGYRAQSLLIAASMMLSSSSNISVAWLTLM
jgi:hypothetical protein